MLSSIDWMLLGVLALSAMLGALRGFVAEVLSIVVWIAAFWFAFQYGANAAEALQPQVSDPAGRLLAAYALVFVLAVVAGSVVTWMVGRMVRSMGLGGVDRFLGLVFGTARGVMLGCLLVLLMGFTELPREPGWSASPLIPEYQRGAEVIRTWLPEAASKHVNFDAVVAQGRQKVVQAVTKQVLESPLPPDAASTAAPSEDSSPQEVPLHPRTKRHRRN